MYCPECGTKIDDKNFFYCPECGTYLSQEEECRGTVEDEVYSHSAVSESCAVSEDGDQRLLCKPTNQKGTIAGSCRGILLTHIPALAEKLGCKDAVVRALLEQFVQIKADLGVFYTLVDAGNYSYRKRGFLGSVRKVKLTPKSPVWEFMDLLMDVYQYEQNEKFPVSEYVFIVGGDDVVPMPCIKHYVDDCSDKHIDTDILYAYPYGKDMVEKLENQEIFKYEQLFYVGRLPVEKDTSYQNLVDYLQRSVTYTYGVPLQGAYGQCDPNWKMVSTLVAQDLNHCDLFRNLDGRLSDDYYYHRLILSPMVTANTVSQVYPTQASLYYYNLHGGDALEARGYFGRLFEGNQMAPALMPAQHQSCVCPNIVVCEACYGARFIGLDSEHSMLLSALYNQTMNYIGSSRIAWGNVDGKATSPRQLGLAFADVIAGCALNALLQGYTAGEALFLGRAELFRQPDIEEPQTPTSVVEFNLYGDPTLFMDVSSLRGAEKKSFDKSALVWPKGHNPCKVELIASKSQTSETSILDQVRHAVDRNLEQIHNIVARQLYEQYGISPRPVSSAFTLEFSDGRKELLLNYDVPMDDQSGLNVRYTVNASTDGVIRKVTSTK